MRVKEKDREHSTNIKESQQAANFNSKNFYF